MKSTSKYIKLCTSCRQFYTLEEEDEYEYKKQTLYCFHIYCQAIDKYKNTNKKI